MSCFAGPFQSKSTKIRQPLHLGKRKRTSRQPEDDVYSSVATQAMDTDQVFGSSTTGLLPPRFGNDPSSISPTGCEGSQLNDTDPLFHWGSLEGTAPLISFTDRK